jgi:hypothetical protein
MATDDHSALIHLVTLDAELDDESFRDWVTKDHFSSVLSRPGWVAARLFECVNGEPRHLIIYHLNEDVATAGRISDGLLRAPHVERRGIRDYHARTFRLIYEVGSNRDQPALVNVITVDVEDAHAAEFSRWYNEVHFPEILACPGWLAGRRYECIDGEPRFLAIYDLEDEIRPFNTPEYEAAVGWDDQLPHIRGYHGFRIYRLVHGSHA